MLMKFFDNSGNEHHIEGDDELDCLRKYLAEIDTVWEKYDDEGNELDDNNFPIWGVHKGLRREIKVALKSL